eukprot:1908758-Karenia_brevis.AAC.1
MVFAGGAVFAEKSGTRGIPIVANALLLLPTPGSLLSKFVKRSCGQNTKRRKGEILTVRQVSAST